MSIQDGWKRLWVLVTLGVVLFSIWDTFQTRNILDMTGSSWYCIPSTHFEEMKTYEDGWTEPTNQEISDQIKKMNALEQASGDKSIDSFAAKLILTRVKYKNISVFSCTSFGKLFSNIFVALIFSVFLAAIFLACQWVLNGFKDNKA